MRAVQKLATVVIVGLVALATMLVLYLANEPNRRDDELEEQEHVAIERGIETFVTNCVVCHGPAGEGYEEPGAEGTGRIGAPLGGRTEATERNQLEDETDRAARAEELTDVIVRGRGLMPPWGDELNDEQIYELVLMIQHVDWDRVYNEAVEAAGGYPTPPAAPGDATDTGPATPAVAEANEITITSIDTDFEPAAASIPAAADVTVILPNEGASLHNFSIDALEIDVDIAPGEAQETVINAEPGNYEYYCDVPGHLQQGMVGTLTVE